MTTKTAGRNASVKTSAFDTLLAKSRMLKKREKKSDAVLHDTKGGQTAQRDAHSFHERDRLVQGSSPGIDLVENAFVGSERIVA